MGCAQSKPEEEAAVALCRERAALLAEAVRRRYELADAHRAYAASLRAVGDALHAFLRCVQTLPPTTHEPALRLPAQRKGDPSPVPVSSAAAAARQVHPAADDVGGHIHFHSDSDSEDGHIKFHSDDDAEPPLPRLEPLPPAAPPTQTGPPYGSGYAPPYASSYGYGAAFGSGGYDSGYGGFGQSFFNISYARSEPPPPSVSYEQRPQASHATVQYYAGDTAEPPQPGPYYGGYPYPPQSSNSYNQYEYGNYGGASARLSPQAAEEAATPPPPPSPPRVSTWDFFNPFESFESYYEQQPATAAAPYAPSGSSRNVREEDIRDKENEVTEDVKGAYSDDKRAGKGKAAKDEGRSSAGEDLHRKSKSSEASTSSGSTLEHVVHVVENSVVGEQLQGSEPQQPPPQAAGKTYNNDTEVVQEIRAQFERASDSASEVSKMLEVGKVPYHQKSSGFKASMVICGFPSMDEEFLQFEEDKAMGCGNLLATLQKLYMWEKKLVEEVKTEEKMRVLYDMKCEELKILDERGAEADKVEATEIYIRKLLTKVNIAIQVINTISDKISKLRDEELWPQTCELIQGLMRMWGIMLECHQIQCHAISQAKNIDSMIAAAKFSEAHMDLVKRLELQLLDWIASFAGWVNAQKSYVNILNEWLKKGINYVPEETDDGVPPFSPGRLGAPPIFIIYNNWAISVGRISEKEVVNAMQAFAFNVLHLWERHRLEQRQGLMANKGMDKDLRVMERDEQSMRKALEAQNRKLILVSNQSGVSLSAQVLHEGSPPAEVGSLQSSLKNIFEAMENFAAASAKTYKDLHLRSEEEKVQPAQGRDRVS